MNESSRISGELDQKYHLWGGARLLLLAICKLDGAAPKQPSKGVEESSSVASLFVTSWTVLSIGFPWAVQEVVATPFSTVDLPDPESAKVSACDGYRRAGLLCLPGVRRNWAGCGIGWQQLLNFILKEHINYNIKARLWGGLSQGHNPDSSALLEAATSKQIRKLSQLKPWF